MANPPPSPDISHLLILLMEEGAEVTQAASKVLRFGPDGTFPGNQFTALDRLTTELGDLYTVVEMLRNQGLRLPIIADPVRSAAKMVKIADMYARTLRAQR